MNMDLTAAYAVHWTWIFLAGHMMAEPRPKKRFKKSKSLEVVAPDGAVQRVRDLSAYIQGQPWRAGFLFVVASDKRAGFVGWTACHQEASRKWPPAFP